MLQLGDSCRASSSTSLQNFEFRVMRASVLHYIHIHEADHFVARAMVSLQAADTIHILVTMRWDLDDLVSICLPCIHLAQCGSEYMESGSDSVN